MCVFLLLQGQIPADIGQLSLLNRLALSDNKLTGSIPEEVSALNLQVLKLSGSNGLLGTLSEEHCHIGRDSCGLNYWWLEYRIDTKDCVLEFDCTEGLCGCDCPCVNSSDLLG